MSALSRLPSEAIRRLDVRFLLADPQLGDVLLAGPADEALVSALAEHARSVHAVAAGDPPRSADAVTVDVAMFSAEPTRELVTACHRALRPGGWLVAEVGGWLGWRPGRSIGASSGAMRLVRGLRAAGYDPVTAYLSWPDHATATALVPLDDPVGLAGWFARRAGRRWAPIAGRGAAWAARTSLPMLVAPRMVVVAQRPASRPPTPGDAPPAPSAPWLAERVDGAVSGTTRRTSIVLLTPRYRASNHVVALADLTRSLEGGPRSVMKVARSEDGATGVDQEATVIRALPAALVAAGRAPALVTARTDVAPAYLVESGVRGGPLDPSAVRRDPRRAVRAVADFIVALSDGGATRRLGDVVEPALERLGRAQVDPGVADLLERTGRAARPMLDHALPIVFEHGDLAHPNLLVGKDGSLAAVDWERARTDGVPVHDLVIGLAYVAGAAHGATTPDAQAAAFDSELETDALGIRTAIAGELERLGIDPDLRRTLTLVPWIRTAAWLAEHTGTDDWMGDRSVAHWRAALSRMVVA